MIGKFREVGWESLNFDGQYNFSEHEHDSTATILRVNRQVFHEAEPVLYQSHDFDFSFHTNLGLNFLQRISERGRLSIRYINMEFAFLPEYAGNSTLDISPDVEEWGTACAYIADNLSLQEFSLDCFFGSVPADFRNAEWVKDLVRIRGLKKLSQEPRHLPSLKQDAWMCKEVDDTPDKVLQIRLSALLKYLRCEMLDEGASESKSVAWDCSGHC